AGHPGAALRGARFRLLQPGPRPRAAGRLVPGARALRAGRRRVGGVSPGATRGPSPAHPAELALARDDDAIGTARGAHVERLARADHGGIDDDLARPAPHDAVA